MLYSGFRSRFECISLPFSINLPEVLFNSPGFFSEKRLPHLSAGQPVNGSGSCIRNESRLRNQGF